MSTTPDWIMEHYKNLVLNCVEQIQGDPLSVTDPGAWTARICRFINGLPETEQSVIHCGLCVDYANPGKRKRAANLPPEMLPGFEAIGGAYQLHPPCRMMRLRQLQYILRWLEQNDLVVGHPLTPIPDTRQPRGWDYATVWEFL